MLKGTKLKLSSFMIGMGWICQAQAGGVSLYEVGSDDVGLATAGYSARAQDPSTVLTNPAGMTRLPGNQLLVGMQVLYENLRFTPISASPFLGTNDGDNPVDAFPGGGLFYSYSLSDALKAGIGLYGNFGSILKYNGDWMGRYSTVKAMLIGTSIQPTLAYRFNNGLSLGAGPVIMYGALRSKTRINNSPFQIFPTHDGELKLSDRAWGFGANVGALYEFNSCTRLGIDYTSEIKLNFNPTSIYTDLAQPLTTVLANRGLLGSEIDIGIRVPQGVMTGFFHQFNPLWAVLASVGWQNWARFGQVDIGIASTNPVSVTVDNHYKDTWHYALGLQHQLNQRWLLNFGVGYDSNFQPNDVPVSTPVNSAWRLGIGTRWAVKTCLDLGLNFEYIRGGTLQVNNQNFVTGDLVGKFKHPTVYFLAVNLNWKQ